MCIILSQKHCYVNEIFSICKPLYVCKHITGLCVTQTTNIILEYNTHTVKMLLNHSYNFLLCAHYQSHRIKPPYHHVNDTVTIIMIINHSKLNHIYMHLRWAKVELFQIFEMNRWQLYVRLATRFLVIFSIKARTETFVGHYRESVKCRVFSIPKLKALKDAWELPY